jgi:SSS family solute:Na+ symporter
MNEHFSALAGLSILPLYFLATVFVGWLARRKSFTANAFLSATSSLSLPIVVAAYLAANSGALEIVGLSALAAQYGAVAFHFYWIGAIPAMIFLALWLMPVYHKSGVKSVPQYLDERYSSAVRLLYACIQAITMLLLAGISLYAMAQIMEVVFGWSFARSVLISAGVVLLYTLLGGVRATIYNEVFQLCVMIAGLAPLSIRSIRLSHLLNSSQAEFRNHLWLQLPTAAPSAQLDKLGVILGLGFVLSFGYWCTDFILMQRAFAARTEAEARQVPLWAGFGKLLFSGLVVLPGLAAHRMLAGLGHTQRFDQALPALMKMLYGPAMLGLGVTALAASLMSGFAANISAFAALWTEDIYRPYLRRNDRDGNYLNVGRGALIVATAVSGFTSYLTFFFTNLMEDVQLIFAVFGAPFWAIFFLGMISPRATSRGAMFGLITGILVALVHLAAVAHGFLHYGSILSADFYGALYAFVTTVFTTTAIDRSSLRTHTQTPGNRLVFTWRAALTGREVAALWILSTLLMTACALLNWIWR